MPCCGLHSVSSHSAPRSLLRDQNPLFFHPSRYTVVRDAMGEDASGLRYSKGLWLAPLEVIDEIYDALLRLPAKGQADYITLGSRDSDVEIYCATKRSTLVKEPFAYTEEQAKSKLTAWRDRRDLVRCDQGTDTEPPAAYEAVSDPAIKQNAPNLMAASDSSVSSVASFAATEADAVRYLRERGYIVAPPYASARIPGDITPPPPYALHLSSSQPVRSVAADVRAPVTRSNKRMRGDDRIAARTTSCPSTPIRSRDNAITPQIENNDDGGDDDNEGEGEGEAVTAPLRKKRRTGEVNDRNNARPPQKPVAPPRCTKTRKGTLTNIISYEAAEELTGVAHQIEYALDIGAEKDGEGGERPVADEDDQAVRLDDGDDGE